MKEVQPIVVRMKVQGGAKGSIIPAGTVEQLTIEILNETALFHFQNQAICRKFADRQEQDGVVSMYSARLQKTVCMYDKMTQAQILQHLKERFEALGAKVKWPNNITQSQ